MLLAVPNVSEGRDLELIRSIAGTPSVPVVLLDIHADPDHDRAVLTLSGPRADLVAACGGIATRALEAVDLRRHRGVHPRIGALDVLPFVPYEEQAAGALRAAADAAGLLGSLGLPVYLYGAAHPLHRTLPEIRKSLAGLRVGTRLDPPPDAGPPIPHPTAGAACVGVRGPLVAFNVNLEGTIAQARAIASTIRGADGGPPSLRALGFALPSRGLVQVSMNLTDPDAFGPRAAFDLVADHARALRARVVDTEVAGLVPASVLDQCTGLPMRGRVRSIEEAMGEAAERRR